MDALVNAKANINGSTIATETQSALSLDSGSLFVLLTTLLVFFGPLFMLFPPFPPSKSDALTETHNKLGPEPSEAPTLTDRIKALLVFAFNAPSVTSDSSNRSGSSSGSVTSLAVYPIASCRGVPLARAKVTPLGLEFDRLFTFAQLKSPFPLASIPENSDDNEVAAKGHRWESITRQQFPELANLEVELWQPDLAKIKGFRDPIAGSSRETFLILRFPWRSEGLIAGLWDVFAAKCSQGRRAQPAIEIMLPVELPNEAERSAKGYEFEELQLRGFSKGSSSSSGGGQKGGEEVVTALNMGADLPRELRWFLGVSNKLALFRLDRGQGSKVVEVDQDSFPIKVTNLASINKNVESNTSKPGNTQEPTLDNSEAHIFVSGPSAHDEASWDRIQLKPTETQEQLDETVFRVQPTETTQTQQALGSKRESNENAHHSMAPELRIAPIFRNNQSSENFIEVGMSIEVLGRREQI